jgi:hypothetical protein
MARKLSKRNRKSSRRRGGNLGAIINTALVPASIFAMQQSYRRKKGGKRTRKHRRH